MSDTTFTRTPGPGWLPVQDIPEAPQQWINLSTLAVIERAPDGRLVTAPGPVEVFRHCDPAVNATREPPAA